MTYLPTGHDLDTLVADVTGEWRIRGLALPA